MIYSMVGCVAWCLCLLALKAIGGRERPTSIKGV